MLPIKKLYIHSRDRTKDSKSSSNFKITLPYTIQLPDNCVFFVTDVCIPNVWQTIDEDFNDRLYLYYNTPSGTPASPGDLESRYLVVKLSPGNYTLTELATEIQTKFRNALTDTAKLFTTFNVSTNVSTNSLTISLSGTYNVSFKLYTDDEVESSHLLWTGGFFGVVDPGNAKSANDVLSHVIPMNRSSSWTSGFVNLQHIHNIYITSPNLGSFDTLSTFSNNIVKKVPVTVGYGFMIVDQFTATNDFLNCSRQTLRTLEFHLRDGRGNEVDLKGMYVTFSLVFNKYPGDI